MHSKRFEELKATGLLPSPTGVGLEILRLTQDEEASANEIARVIRTDPALTGRTLRLANTGDAAASRPVTNIADAVARLGTRAVRAISLGFTVLAGNRSGKCVGFDYQQFWSRSLAHAIAAQVLCSHTRKYPAADGFAAGLLAEIGRLALASMHSEKYAAVLAQWANGNQAELVRLEQKAFVTDHNELSAALIADWGLPQAVSDAALHHEDPRAGEFENGSPAQHLALVLHAAARLADVCIAASDTRAATFVADLLARCEAIGIGADSVVELFDRVFDQWTDWGRVLNVPTREAPKLGDLIRSGEPALPARPANSAPAPAQPVEPAVESQHAGNPTGVADAREGQNGLLVLVADGDPSSLRFLEKFLVLSGHRVRCATGGREGLQIFFESAPQLVIVDATLPEIGGLEFSRRLRRTAAGRQAYVIILTAPDDEETLIRLFEAGVDDFVTKPFAARPLFARIRASLRVVSLQKKLNHDREQLETTQSELAIAHRRLEQDALTDVLTGLPNRRYLIDRLAHDWAAARRGGTPLACMMLDIDHFKAVNDTYGHDVGDVVLRSVARVLQHVVRGTDVVCRYGGEEFVVISAADMDSAMRCAERLRVAVQEQAITQVGLLKDAVTVSVGVAVRNESTRSPEALLKAADEALFLAKRNGRNRVANTRDLRLEAAPKLAASLADHPAGQTVLDVQR